MKAKDQLNILGGLELLPILSNNLNLINIIDSSILVMDNIEDQYNLLNNQLIDIQKILQEQNKPLASNILPKIDILDDPTDHPIELIDDIKQQQYTDNILKEDKEILINSTQLPFAVGEKTTSEELRKSMGYNTNQWPEVFKKLLKSNSITTNIKNNISNNPFEIGINRKKEFIFNNLTFEAETIRIKAVEIQIPQQQQSGPNPLPEIPGTTTLPGASPTGFMPASMQIETDSSIESGAQQTSYNPGQAEGTTTPSAFRTSAPSVGGGEITSPSESSSFSEIQGGTGSWREDTEFRSEVERVAQKFDIDSNDLLAIMQSESGPNIDPKIQNSIGATGIIQFTGSTARGLGTTTEQLKGMSRAEQMKFVEKYFNSVGLPRGASPGQLYASIFLPAFMNREVLTTRGERYYDQNAGLDLDKDGKITRADLDQRVASIRQRFGLGGGAAAINNPQGGRTIGAQTTAARPSRTPQRIQIPRQQQTQQRQTTAAAELVDSEEVPLRRLLGALV